MSYTYKFVKITKLFDCEPHAVLRKEDNAYIPFDENNIDYQEYLAWKAIDGNEPEAAE